MSARDQQSMSAPSNSDREEGSIAGGIVLLIEDDPSIGRIAEIALSLGGLKVVHAPDGHAALSYMESEAPAAAVLDPGLPDGLGAQVLRRLNEAGVPVLILSALDQDRASVTYSIAQEAFMSKPFDPQEMLEEVERLLLSDTS